MAHRVQQVFKYIMAVAAATALTMCTRPAKLRVIINTDAKLATSNGMLYYNDTLFTGTLYGMYNTHDTMFVEQYANGILNGPVKKWYATGVVAQQITYADGIKTGTGYSWWPNGKKKAVYSYKTGLFDGNAMEWYNTGQPYRKMFYIMGHESGLQQMWDAKGNIIANYDMRNGRKYGLTAVIRCVTGDK